MHCLTLKELTWVTNITGSVTKGPRITGKLFAQRNALFSDKPTRCHSSGQERTRARGNKNVERGAPARRPVRTDGRGRRQAGRQVAAAAARVSLVEGETREQLDWKSAMWVSSDSILGGLTAASILVILVEAAAAVEIIDSKNTEDQSGGLATVAGYERQPKIFGLGISDRTTTVSV